MSPSELFHDPDFLALKESLGLVPTFSDCWTPAIQVAYQDSVLDSIREEERKAHSEAVLRSLHCRNYNKKHGLNVFETSYNNLSISFEQE